MKKKTFLMGLYVAIIYAIVIFSMTSCSSRRDRMNDEPIDVRSKGDIILFYPNGTDTTITVSSITLSQSNTVVFYDMDRVKHISTLDYLYKR